MSDPGVEARGLAKGPNLSDRRFEHVLDEVLAVVVGAEDRVYAPANSCRVPGVEEDGQDGGD